MRPPLAIAALLLLAGLALVGACRSRLPVDHVPRPVPSPAVGPDLGSPPAAAPATPQAPPAPPAVVAAPLLHVEYYQISDG